jgi:hypothetical protein
VVNGPVCPPECQKELKHLWKKFDSLTQMRKDAWSDCKTEQIKQWEIIDNNYKHWEGEVGMRVKTQTLIAVVGIVVTIVLGLLGISFRSLSSSLDKTLISQQAVRSEVIAVQRSVDRMEVKVESIEKSADKEHRRSEAERRRRGTTGNSGNDPTE